MCFYIQHRTKKQEKISNINFYSANIFVLKTAPTYLIYCIQTTYIMEGNTMNPDQTAPKVAV